MQPDRLAEPRPDQRLPQSYAFHNRRLMLTLLAEAVEAATGASPDMASSTNIHHNFCACEDCTWKARPLAQVHVNAAWVA